VEALDPLAALAHFGLALARVSSRVTRPSAAVVFVASTCASETADSEKSAGMVVPVMNTPCSPSGTMSSLRIGVSGLYSPVTSSRSPYTRDSPLAYASQTRPSPAGNVGISANSSRTAGELATGTRASFAPSYR
jgi:hypothetical protein